MLLMLTIQTRGYLGPSKDYRYHLQDHSGGKSRGWRRYFTMHTPSYENIIEDVLACWKLDLFWTGWPLYSLSTQRLIAVTTVTLHNYICQKAQRYWLFEKHSYTDMICYDNDDKEEDKMIWIYTVTPGQWDGPIQRQSCQFNAEGPRVRTCMWQFYVIWIALRNNSSNGLIWISFFILVMVFNVIFIYL